jgi:hypothetical protein
VRGWLAALAALRENGAMWRSPHAGTSAGGTNVQCVIAEGNETPRHDPTGPSQPPPGGSEGFWRSGEGDLLAERRARRAAELPDRAMAMRAEAAEATVRTLETHMATLQRRLREAEEQTQRLSAALGAQAPVSGGESAGGNVAEANVTLERELTLARAREHEQHRARRDAEERAAALERGRGGEIDRLAERLALNERYVRSLGEQIHELQQRLAEAERRADAELAAAHASRAALAERVALLERRTLEVDEDLRAERAQRERAERMLTGMRRGQRRVESVVREMAAVVSRLRSQASPASQQPVRALPPRPPAPAATATAATSSPLPLPPPTPAVETTGGPVAGQSSAGAGHNRNEELAGALAAAVERLRARSPEQFGHGSAGGAGATVQEPAQAASTTPSEPSTANGEASPASAPHKHSMSLITRVRVWRKQRRERR